MRKAYSSGPWHLDELKRLIVAVTRRLRMEPRSWRDAAGPQDASDNAWSSLRSRAKTAELVD